MKYCNEIGWNDNLAVEKDVLWKEIDGVIFDEDFYCLEHLDLVKNCCKLCSYGKACGDVCIPQESTCKKDFGCACNYYK